MFTLLCILYIQVDDRLQIDDIINNALLSVMPALACLTLNDNLLRRAITAPRSHVEVVCSHQQLQRNLRSDLELRNVLAGPAARRAIAVRRSLRSQLATAHVGGLWNERLQCRQHSSTASDSRIGPAQLVVAVLAHALQDGRRDLREPHLPQLRLCEAPCMAPRQSALWRSKTEMLQGFWMQRRT